MSFSNPTSTGEKHLNLNAGYERYVISQKLTGATSASKQLSMQIPANSRVIAAGLKNASAITLATAVRLGLGTSADPDRFVLSSTTMTINTEHGPTLTGSRGLLFSNQVPSDAVTSTSTETNFAFTGQTLPTIPASFFKPGDVIRIRCHGRWTALNAGDAVIINTKVGSVTVSSMANNVGAADDIWVTDVAMSIRAVGTSGTCVASEIGTLDVDANNDPIVADYIASTAINTETAAAIVVTAKFNSANASNTIRCDGLIVEHIRQDQPMCDAATTLLVSSVSASGVQVGTFTGDVYAWVWVESFASLP